jgi:AraC-like DNA-binding protein
MLDRFNLKEKHKIFSSPATDIEHRTSHNSDHAVLSVFETQTITHSFDLKFDNPSVVSMIQGKKVMHLKSKDPFEFTPGETIVMPASELMYIDFPEASQEIPTQCMALEISDGFVRNTMTWLNEYFPKVDEGSWNWTKENFLLMNNQNVQESLNRLIRTMVQNNYGKQLMASNATRELIAMLMQTNARHFLLNNLKELSTRNRLAGVVHFIRKNITSKFTVDELAEKACLSRAQFFRSFQREMGETPVEFVNKERLRLAKRHMLQHNRSASQASYESGFSSLNYFSRTFKKYEGVSPNAWKAAKMPLK